MPGLQTEYTFTLPKGYVDAEGALHRHGTMRLATARDEIEPLRDQRVSGPDDPYLTILVISRVLTTLGTMRQITPRDVEGLFAADLAFLQDLYGIINFGDPADVEELQRAVLPDEPEVARPGDEGEHAPEQPAHVVADGDDAAPVDNTSFDSPRVVRRRGQIEEVPSRPGR